MSVNRREFLKRAGAGAAILAGGKGLLHGSAFAMNPVRFQGRSDVSFVGSSSSGTRRQMILDVLEPWRATVEAGSAGKTVLIKPNMVFWGRTLPDPALPLTAIDAVRGLIDFLRSINPAVPILIGDIPAYRDPDMLTFFTNAGYDVLTSEYTDVTLVDLTKTANFPSIKYEFWTPDFSLSTLSSIPITSAFVNSNYYVISIARPKTHNCMVMTGVNKNMLMAAPLNSVVVDNKDVSPKQFMHGKNGWNSGQHTDENKCLSYNLFQMANIIYATGAPALSVLDAWEGLEGEGPVHGSSVMQYCAVAGIDPLAVDRLAAKLMGFSDTATDPINKETPSYTDMRMLVWISNAGFGNYDLDKINFILGSLAELERYVLPYTLHSNYTDDPSYETEWTGGPPPAVLGPSAVKESRFLDPKPYLVPQIRKAIRSGDVTINFTLPVEFAVQLGIFNLQGAEVRRLGDEFLPAGRYTVVWNGCDNRGSRVPAGNYLITLKFGSRALCDRVCVVR